MVENDCVFLRKRMIAFRDTNDLSLEEMAKKILDRRMKVSPNGKNTLNRTTLYRAEGGREGKSEEKTGAKKVREFYEEYWKALYDPEGLLDKKEALSGEEESLKRMLKREFYIFTRGERVVVVDFSAIIKSKYLIEELAMEYTAVFIPSIVLRKLENGCDIQSKAVLDKINKVIENSSNVILDEDNECEEANSTDWIKKIIMYAERVSEDYISKVEIIVDDEDFERRLCKNDDIKVLTLDEYREMKQCIINIESLKKLNDYFDDSYDNYKDVPNGNDINAYLPDGNTLIISVVRNKENSLEQRKEKIRWLLSKGMDVDIRDIGSRYMPPLSHAILVDDFEIFKFLLEECNADPNIGSRNPYSPGKVRQDNEGVMPLMIAAERNMSEYVKVLLNDERISINQQDGYGRTALIIAAVNKSYTCIDLLKDKVDNKIVDRDDCTFEDRLKE